jgi:shikimate 5-dehydrogenase
MRVGAVIPSQYWLAEKGAWALDQMNSAMRDRYQPAEQPTMYFIGVTTTKSSINQIFPLWAERLKLGSCQLKGIDFQLHDKPELYREVVEFIKGDPYSLGALVTTHKIDLCDACRDLFDALDPLSDSMEEVSSIFKRDGKLHGRAVDPISSGLALEAFLPRDHWKSTGGEVFILGAGGSAVALTWYLVQSRYGANRPARVHVANPTSPRLDHLEKLHASWKSGIPLECHVVEAPEAADSILGSLKPGSLIVNATGLGKDAPGSPITEEAKFPVNGVVWEFNYRGDLIFLQQAKSQQAARNLTIEDGWNYFVHGWTRVIADVFEVEIPTQGSVFDELSRIAANAR